VFMSRIETIAFGIALATLASPAFAGQPTPAPIAGFGIGAVVLVGLGYRALKNRTRR
jgi:membrane protein implicated in regulation of membrane protease activity